MQTHLEDILKRPLLSKTAAPRQGRLPFQSAAIILLRYRDTMTAIYHICPQTAHSNEDRHSIAERKGLERKELMGIGRGTLAVMI